MSWLERYQPSVDWMNMIIVINKSCSTIASCMATKEMVWAYASVEKVTDVSSDIAVCNVPPCSYYSLDKSNKTKVTTTTKGGAVRCQREVIPFAIDMEVMVDSSMKNSEIRGKDQS
ncbi:hypothetical protein Plhal304r1_c039g0117301 [Plasmopara halstedii]